MNIIEKIDKRFAINSNYNETFDKFAIACYDLHDNVNQKYDNNPYSLHLRMVTNMLPIVFNDAWECGFIINNMYEQTLLKIQWVLTLVNLLITLMNGLIF